MKNNIGEQTLESMSQAVWYNQWTFKKFLAYLKGDILEVGCGIGNFTKDLTEYGNVWAVDIEDEYITQTKKRAEKAHVGLGDIEKGNYFFKQKKFQSIVCLNVLEHIEKDDVAFSNLYSLLENDGYLILLVPAHPFLYGSIDKSIGHFRRYKRKDLTKILTSIGFKIIKSRVINFLGAIGWWISSRLLANNRVDESKIRLFNFTAPVVLPLEDLLEPPIGTSILIIAKK